MSGATLEKAIPYGKRIGSKVVIATRMDSDTVSYYLWKFVLSIYPDPWFRINAIVAISSSYISPNEHHVIDIILTGFEEYEEEDGHIELRAKSHHIYIDVYRTDEGYKLWTFCIDDDCSYSPDEEEMKMLESLIPHITYQKQG